jgi:hypothetical protein
MEKQEEIPATDRYEVIASMRASAESLLQKMPFAPLSDAQARRFTGAYYTCPKNKRPFLVRALYRSGGTSRFWAYKISNSIWILHESTEIDSTILRTAFVLNIDFAPTQIYVSTATIR